MPLISLGLNHKTCPVALRERVAVDATRAPEALAELRALEGVDEAVILSTCNRTEIYLNADERGEIAARQWLHHSHGLRRGELDEFLYGHQEAETVRHAFRVASGLDSMVLGEPQILGQMKEAYLLARASGSLSGPMDRLFQQTFSIAKRVRSETAIGANPVSVAFAAVRLARQIFDDLSRACVLLIGAGDTIELAARHLAETGISRLIVANRTLERAQALAGQHGGYAITLSELPRHLAEADVVLSSTAARDPILTRDMVAAALRTRRHKPMFMVDIAVPRDIEPDVARLDDVFLYTVDDLRQVVEENLRSRSEAAREAEAIIELQVGHFMDWRRAHGQQRIIASLRDQAESQRREVLERAREQLQRGRSPEEALEFLAHTLTNRLMHAPSAALRQAALRGDTSLIDAAQDLFGLTQQSTDQPDA